MRLKNFQNSLFFSVFSVFLFFGSAIYSLLFRRSMRVLFALKIASFLALFFSTFCRFFACVSQLRSLLSSVAAAFMLYLPPPYTGGAEISLTPKKIFFYFFNIDICRNFFFYFFTFWHIVMVK